CVVDGGNVAQEIFLIKIPLLKDAIIFTTLLRSIWEFNNVDLIFTLTGGGPGNATNTLTMYMTNMAVKNGNYGYGSTIAVVAFVILAIFATIYLSVTGYAKED
ncbi:MAG: sugar ABC transporter permease, partial [Lachnospiraceae bacterium]|nr:sugar ABC transporter permease [Lachnospiraceae bacterium]